jgi:hypothetical protein
MSSAPKASSSPPKVSALHAFGTGHRVRHPFEGKTDTRRRRKLKDVARTLPRTPGVYFFYGFNDRLLYIGKAKCLRERVRSYFAETSLRRPPKLRRLLAEIKRIEWQECACELEALLVERRLIADLQPILNRQHKRFLVYPYLLLSDEAFPRFTLTRAEPVDGVSEPPTSTHSALGFDNIPIETQPHVGELPGLYLGPFTSPRVAAWTFEAVRTLFPLRSCEGAIRPDPTDAPAFIMKSGVAVGRASAPRRKSNTRSCATTCCRCCKAARRRRSMRCARVCSVCRKSGASRRRCNCASN